MPRGGLGIYALGTTGIDGVGMGALEMQILAALATSGGPLLGQTGAAWTVEKTQPHDAPRDLKDAPALYPLYHPATHQEMCPLSVITQSQKPHKDQFSCPLG